MREVEVKYRIRDAEALFAALKGRGIELGAPVRQDDQAYAPDGWAYGDARCGVPFARLHTMGGQHVFTVQRPAENVLSCEEHETVVADRNQMHHAILAMGFWPTVRIVKARRTATFGDLVVCVDELNGLGFFLRWSAWCPATCPVRPCRKSRPASWPPSVSRLSRSGRPTIPWCAPRLPLPER